MNANHREGQSTRKVVFITGVSRGIGREMFMYCARRADLEVLGVSRNTEALKEMEKTCKGETLEEAHLFTHDITQPLTEEIKKCLNRWGRIDVLVNNAGVLVNKPFLEISHQDWLRCYETNVYGPLRLIQETFSWLSLANGAHVINIGSMGGVQGSVKFPGLSAYSSSKAAMLGMAECIAEELKDSTMRVNTVNLGAVQTEMLNEAFPGFEASHQPAEVAKWLIEFGLNSGAFMHGKSIQLSDTTP